MFSLFRRNSAAPTANAFIHGADFNGKCINNHPELPTVVGYRDTQGKFFETAEETVASNKRIENEQIKKELAEFLLAGMEFMWRDATVNYTVSSIAEQIVANPAKFLETINNIYLKQLQDKIKENEIKLSNNDSKR